MATATTRASQTRATQTRRLRRVVEVALAAYDVRPVRVRRLPRGWNATFGVQADDGSRFALRVHRPGGPGEAEVRSELAWLAAVAADTDLVVPRPRPTRDGDRVVVVDDPAVVDDGPRVCDLLRWVDGHFVDARLTPAHLRTIGTLMADLAEHGRRFVRPDGFVRPDVTRWTTSPGAATTRSGRPCSTGPPTRSPRSTRTGTSVSSAPRWNGPGRPATPRPRTGGSGCCTPTCTTRTSCSAPAQPVPTRRSRPASSTSTTAETDRTPTTRR